jgi:hypothetical protein
LAVANKAQRLLAKAVQIGVEELAKRSSQLGVSWRLRPATCLADEAAIVTRVTLDGDSAVLPATSLIGPIPAGSRVMMLLTPPAGVYVVGWYGPAASPSLLQTMQVFTSSGTWTKPAGLVAVRVRVLGGGGAGGGAATTAAGQASVGGGGGAAQYNEAVIPAAALAASEVVTIGAGGAGVSGAGGNAGGTSSFGPHVISAGGNGGGTAVASYGVTHGVGGNGGSGAAGTFSPQIDLIGADGSTAVCTAGSVQSLGHGGSGPLGGGQRASTSASGAAGLGAPANTGAGGSGGFNYASQAARLGGAGGSGIVVVEDLFWLAV